MVGEGDIVSVVDDAEERRDGVDTFREGRGVVAGVTYASRPAGKMVLYNLMDSGSVSVGLE